MLILGAHRECLRISSIRQDLKVLQEAALRYSTTLDSVMSTSQIRFKQQRRTATRPLSLASGIKIVVHKLEISGIQIFLMHTPYK